MKSHFYSWRKNKKWPELISHNCPALRESYIWPTIKEFFILSNAFFCIHWYDHLIFILHFVYGMYNIDWFTDIVPTLRNFLFWIKVMLRGTSFSLFPFCTWKDFQYSNISAYWLSKTEELEYQVISMEPHFLRGWS